MSYLKILSVFSLLTSLSICFYPGSSMAQMDPKQMSALLKNMNLDKGQLMQNIDLMVSKGLISAEDASKAKRELKGMNDYELKMLKSKTVESMKDPKVKKRIEEAVNKLK